MNDAGFESPLAITHPSRWTAIDFGCIPPDPGVDRLANDMEAEIRRVAALLPARLAMDAAATIDGYPGPDRPFIGLFYRPVFSMLHWLDVGGAGRAAAVRVHALALLLHLWDDHLSDGQLAPSVARLHLRTLAWREMEAALPGDGPDALETRALLNTYLDAVHRPESVASLEAHIDRFCRQIAIWRAGPRMLARRTGGERVAALIDQALVQFCIAWRLIDDVQDLEADRATGQDNAVRLALEGTSAALWDSLKGQPPEALPPDADEALPRAVGTVLTRAVRALETARAAADAAGLSGWATELEQAAQLAWA